MEFNKIFDELSQDILLGKGCPCEGHHHIQRSDFIKKSNRVGLGTVHRKMVDAILDYEITFDRIAALDIMSIWLNDEDLGNRLTFPVVINEPTKRLLENFRPKLRPLIINALIANHKLVKDSSGRHDFKHLMNVIAPVSDEAVQRVIKWLEGDAVNRAVDIQTMYQVCKFYVPFNLVIDIPNEPFEERWLAYWNDGFLNLARHYFDPRLDSEDLIVHINQLGSDKRHQFLSMIPKGRLRWKRFLKMLHNNDGNQDPLNLYH